MIYSDRYLLLDSTSKFLFVSIFLISLKINFPRILERDVHRTKLLMARIVHPKGEMNRGKEGNVSRDALVISHRHIA